MLDTVGIGCHLDGLRPGSLVDRGWTVNSTTSLQGSTTKFYLDLGKARVKYFDGIGWLGIEASLPKLVQGDNAALLDVAGCRDGVRMLWDLARDAVGHDVPGLADCLVSRFDPVYGWPYDPAPYIGALVASRLPRTIPVRFGSSVRWITPKGRVRGRCYDKAQEQGHAVDLPLRFERQVLAKKSETVRVGGAVIGRAVEEALSPGVCQAVLSDALHAVGLDRPILSVMASRRALVDRFGSRSGFAAWAALRDVIDNGGVWSTDISPWRRRKYERMWRDAGISATSPQGELPALDVPLFH